MFIFSIGGDPSWREIGVTKKNLLFRRSSIRITFSGRLLQTRLRRVARRATAKWTIYHPASPLSLSPPERICVCACVYVCVCFVTFCSATVRHCAGVTRFWLGGRGRRRLRRSVSRRTRAVAQSIRVKRESKRLFSAIRGSKGGGTLHANETCHRWPYIFNHSKNDPFDHPIDKLVCTGSTQMNYLFNRYQVPFYLAWNKECEISSRTTVSCFKFFYRSLDVLSTAQINAGGWSNR